MSQLHLDESVSARLGLSPGVVEDHERLLRTLFNPDHVKDGKLIVSAIPLDDLRSRGFSVYRLSYVVADDFRYFVSKFLSRMRDGQPRKFEGVAVMEVRGVRGIFADGKQAFVVIDTAEDSNVAHASIYLSDVGLRQSRAREMRKLLLPLLQERVSMDEALSR